MSTKDRWSQILDCLEKEKIVYTNHLVARFQVSEATIRRDLTQMEEAGQLKRIPGGAVQMRSGQILHQDDEIFMHERLSLNMNAKANICRAAASLVQDGECIFLDGGSSLAPMIDELKDRKVRIVTHNHLLISRLTSPTKAEIYTLGGRYVDQYAMSVGPDTIRQVSTYNFDRCFVGCAGVDLDENMAYTTESETKAIKLAAMRASTHSHLLIDSTKMGIRAFCKFSSLDVFDSIYCDSQHKEIEYPDNFVFV